MNSILTSAVFIIIFMISLVCSVDKSAFVKEKESKNKLTVRPNDINAINDNNKIPATLSSLPSKNGMNSVVQGDENKEEEEKENEEPSDQNSSSSSNTEAEDKDTTKADKSLIESEEKECNDNDLTSDKKDDKSKKSEESNEVESATKSNEEPDSAINPEKSTSTIEKENFKAPPGTETATPTNISNITKNSDGSKEESDESMETSAKEHTTTDSENAEIKKAESDESEKSVGSTEAEANSTDVNINSAIDEETSGNETDAGTGNAGSKTDAKVKKTYESKSVDVKGKETCIDASGTAECSALRGYDPCTQTTGSYSCYKCQRTCGICNDNGPVKGKTCCQDSPNTLCGLFKDSPFCRVNLIANICPLTCKKCTI